MILAVNDKRRQDYLKDGKVLWNLRNNGGGGKGLMAGGIVLLIFGVLLFACSLSWEGVAAVSFSEASSASPG